VELFLGVVERDRIGEKGILERSPYKSSSGGRGKGEGFEVRKWPVSLFLKICLGGGQGEKERINIYFRTIRNVRQTTGGKRVGRVSFQGKKEFYWIPTPEGGGKYT